MPVSKSELEQAVRQRFASFGRKGGRARAESLSDEELSEIGRKGGKASGKVRKNQAEERAREWKARRGQ